MTLDWQPKRDADCCDQKFEPGSASVASEPVVIVTAGLQGSHGELKENAAFWPQRQICLESKLTAMFVPSFRHVMQETRPGTIFVGGSKHRAYEMCNDCFPYSMSRITEQRSEHGYNMGPLNNSSFTCVV